MATIEKKIEDLVSRTINELGYEIYDIEYVKEGKNYYLRIYIDSKNGIDLNDCEKVNNGIMDLLDSADYIKEQYFLEISSPGVERILKKDKHLKDNLQNQVQVKLFKPLDGKKELKGILADFDDNYITIQTNSNVKVDRKNIAQIKTVYNW